MICNKNRFKEKIEIIDPTKFGPQHGYDSGRSGNLKIKIWKKKYLLINVWVFF